MKNHLSDEYVMSEGVMAECDRGLSLVTYEAEAQVKEYCRLNMEQMTCVEVNIEPKYFRMDGETDKLLKDLKVLLREGDNK